MPSTSPFSPSSSPLWVQELRDALKGEVRSDPVSLAVYSVDASIYEVTPLAVAIVQDQEDLEKAVEIAKRHQIPLIPRGAATGIAGGAIGKGLVIDTAEYLHRILHIDPIKQEVTCEPGVVQNALNAAIAPFGLRLGPDTSTGNRATLAGMLANNAAGSRSLRYGAMRHHIQEVHLLLASGEKLHLKPLDEHAFAEKCGLRTQEGEIYRTLAHLREHHAEDIKNHYPPLPRRSSGYALDSLLGPFPFFPSCLIAGSEGTLGIITQMTLKLSTLPHLSALLVLSFDTLEQALDAVVTLLKLQPLTLELIDAHIIEAASRSPALQGSLNHLPLTSCTMLIVELDAETASLLEIKVYEAQEYATRQTSAHRIIPLFTTEEQNQMWKLREAGLGLLLSKRSYQRAVAFIEDLSIPPEKLKAFMKEFLALLRREGKDAGIYGHVGAGCVHIRPYLDLRDQDELQTMQRIMEETTALIVRFSGALSGEHGDGLIRSWLNPVLFGPTMMHCFQSIKQAFDPEGRMNPGKILPTQRLTDSLRLSPKTKIRPFKPFLDFSSEGGFALSVDLCNGNGQCRKQEGLMCPSFHAYGKEWHTTRARAQGLRAWMHQEVPNTPETSKGILSLLEYCIECKGCKRECPSQVDMAKMKAEFLYQYQKESGVPFRTWLFAHLGKLYRLASWAPSLSNWLLQRSWVRALLARIGITKRRSLPSVAAFRFSTYCKTNPSTPLHPSGHSVVLCLDTYTEFLEPNIGKSAKRLLEDLGFEVTVPKWACCGRTFFSRGLLKEARTHAAAFIEHYASYAEKGLPLLHLEPSCFSMVEDDMGALCKDKAWKCVKEATVLFDHFVLKHFGSSLPNWLDFTDNPLSIDLHTHCHEKALLQNSATRILLKRCKGVTLSEVDMGCCGLAGSFGYESEHAQFSLDLGEKKLFSKLRSRQAGHICIANGLSCRNQIRDGTHLKPLHIAEWLYQQMT